MRRCALSCDEDRERRISSSCLNREWEENFPRIITEKERLSKEEKEKIEEARERKKRETEEGGNREKKTKGGKGKQEEGEN